MATGDKVKGGELTMRVLLVEDDPTTSKSIELMLTHARPMRT